MLTKKSVDSKGIKTLKKYEWQIVGLIALLTFLAGIKGFSGQRNFIDSLYLSLQLFVLQSGDVGGYVNNYLQISRFFAPLIVAYATLKSVYGLFKKDFGLLLIKNHIVICGLSNESLYLLKDLLNKEKKSKVVLIENSSDEYNLLNLKEEGAILIHEPPSDISALKKAKIKRAKAIFVINERDEQNIEIVSNIYRIFGKKESLTTVPCIVHIYEPVIEKIFKAHSIFTEPKDKLDARVVNVYQKGSRLLVNEFQRKLNKSLKNDKEMKIMIMGLGWLGKSILTHLALFHHAFRSKKLCVTIVDKNAESEVQLFKSDYPSVSDLLSITTMAKNIEIISDEELYSKEAIENYDAVFCCAGEDVVRIKAITKIYEMLSSYKKTKLFLCIQKNSDLSKLIDEGNFFEEKKDKIILFNLLKETCTFEELVNEEIEKMAKEIHKRYCEFEIAKGVKTSANPSLVEWDNLDDETKEDNRDQAYNIKLKLGLFGYSIVPLTDKKVEINFLESRELIEKLAKAEHIRWWDKKTLEGWRFTTGKKDKIKKLNPAMIPYEQLPEDTKNKNKEPIKNIPDLLKIIGKKIVKSDELILSEKIELIAQKIHEQYYRAETAKGYTEKENPSLVIWELLSEDLKRTNRQQAEDIIDKTDRLGCRLVPVSEQGDEYDPTSEEELLEKLAKEEHERWCYEKREAGWTFAEGEKNPNKKTHPDLVEYEELSEEAKEKDRDTIRNIPGYMRLIGLKIVKKNSRKEIKSK